MLLGKLSSLKKISIKDIDISSLNEFHGSISSASDLPKELSLISGIDGSDKYSIRYTSSDRMSSALMINKHRGTYLFIVNNSSIGKNYKRVNRLAEDAGYLIENIYFVNSHVLDEIYKGIFEVSDSKISNEAIENFNSLINSAIDLNAANVNLEYSPNKYLNVAFKIYKQNIHQYNIPKELGIKMITAFYRSFDNENKSDADFNVNKKTDASCIYTYGSRQFTLRWYGGPSHSGGYDITIRLNEIGQNILGFDQIGYDKKTKDFLDFVAAKDSGLFLWVGATDSGKTTSNASFILNMLQKSSFTKKCTTIEDPVEMLIPTVHHHSLFSDKTVKDPWETAIKDFKRQAPDIVFIGEIRDAVVARCCVDEVLSGHFTISTFHSKTWDEALIRLIKVFGVDPNTLCMSSILKGILAQKLTPIICDECSLKYEDIESGLTKREKLKLSEYFSECYEQLRFKNIHDLCNKCEKTNGVIGLKPIYEIYKPTKEINSLIINDKFAEARNKWEQVNDGINGITFLDRAKELVVQGLVDPIWVIDTLLEEI